MAKKFRFITVGSVVLSLALGGAAAAHATDKQTALSAKIPGLQQSHYVNSQKRTTTKNSQIRFSSISSNLLLNVKAQNLSNDAQYTENKGLGVDSTYTITNKTPKGSSSRLIITQYDWNLLSPTAKGWYNIK